MAAARLNGAMDCEIEGTRERRVFQIHEREEYRVQLFCFMGTSLATILSVVSSRITRWCKSGCIQVQKPPKHVEGFEFELHNGYDASSASRVFLEVLMKVLPRYFRR